MSYTERPPSSHDRSTGSNTSDVLIELMRAISEPGAIHPALAAAVREQAFAVHEFGRLRLRGTAFDGRLFAIEEWTTPALRALSLV
jgi:hypothetical protein